MKCVLIAATQFEVLSSAISCDGMGWNVVSTIQENRKRPKPALTAQVVVAWTYLATAKPFHFCNRTDGMNDSPIGANQLCVRLTYHVSDCLSGKCMLLIPLAGIGCQLFVRKVAAHLVDHLMLLRKL